MESIQIAKKTSTIIHLDYIRRALYLSFKDSRGELQTIEIDEVLYGLFNRFELEDISYLNKLSRHIEHSELTEASLNDRAFCKPESIEEKVSRNYRIRAVT